MKVVVNRFTMLLSYFFNSSYKFMNLFLSRLKGEYLLLCSVVLQCC